jgi:hypothetical protein
MASVLKEIQSIENAFSDIISKFKFKKISEKEYKIRYSNGKCILNIFSGPYDDSFEIAFERDTIKKQIMRFFGDQDYDVKEYFYPGLILEAFNRNEVLQLAVKESRLIHKNTYKGKYSIEAAIEIRRKTLLIWAKTIEENLQTVLLGNFDFENEHNRIAKIKGEEDLKELMDRYKE